MCNNAQPRQQQSEAYQESYEGTCKEEMEQNWNDIRYFLVLSRTRSFVSAAVQLKVTHSTVSRRISALESDLQTKLFVRTEKGCRLTPAGEQLLPLAEDLERSALRFQAQVSRRMDWAMFSGASNQ